MDHALTFPVGQLHEDETFILFAMFFARRAAVIRSTLFDRRVREDSIMTRPVSRKNVTGNLKNMVEILRFLEAHRGEYELDADVGTSALAAWRIAAIEFNGLAEEERALYIKELPPDLLFYHTIFVLEEASLRKRTADLENKLLSEQRKSKQLDRIKKSRSYRLARLIGWPVRALRRLLRIGEGV